MTMTAVFTDTTWFAACADGRAARYGAHNQVTSGTTATYDGDGNQTLSTVTGLNWNAAGQVASTTGGTTATYDALGRMVETNGTTATQYIYSPLGSQYAVVQNGALMRGLVPLPGGDTAVYNSAGLN